MGTDVWLEDSPCKNSLPPPTPIDKLDLWSTVKIFIAEGQVCFLCAFLQPRGVNAQCPGLEGQGGGEGPWEPSVGEEQAFFYP